MRESILPEQQLNPVEFLKPRPAAVVDAIVKPSKRSIIDRDAAKFVSKFLIFDAVLVGGGAALCATGVLAPLGTGLLGIASMMIACALVGVMIAGIHLGLMHAFQSRGNQTPLPLGASAKSPDNASVQMANCSSLARLSQCLAAAASPAAKSVPDATREDEVGEPMMDPRMFRGKHRTDTSPETAASISSYKF